jgi:uncharacterized protein YbjQ (UPF0145 family)
VRLVPNQLVIKRRARDSCNWQRWHRTTSSQVLLAKNLPGRSFKELGPIEVTVKKLTVFHKDPTREQANEALIERAKVLGADAVINIAYKNGIGFTSWGYIEAKGVAVKLLP